MFWFVAIEYVVVVAMEDGGVDITVIDSLLDTFQDFLIVSASKPKCKFGHWSKMTLMAYLTKVLHSVDDKKAYF